MEIAITLAVLALAGLGAWMWGRRGERKGLVGLAVLALAVVVFIVLAVLGQG